MPTMFVGVYPFTCELEAAKLNDDVYRYVIKKILNQTAKTGLIEGHHFFINFATASNDVVMSPRLKDQYPEEMSIIIKNWYNITL